LLASLDSVEIVVDLGSLAMQRHTIRELSVVIRFLHDSFQIHHSRKTWLGGWNIVLTKPFGSDNCRTQPIL